MSDTILENENLLNWLRENPWMYLYFLILDIQDTQEWQEQREQVRLRLVEAHSSSPLYQARAAKDPEYWNKFYIGRVR